MEFSNPLDQKVILHNLETEEIAQNLQLIQVTESTNKDILDYAENDAPHGYTLIADSQTKGRGRQRMGAGPRTWISPPGLNIYTSILLRSQTCHPSLVLCAGVAVAELIKDLCRLVPVLKWPNDVLINGKKISGILLQTKNNYIAVGIGLNVNGKKTDFYQFADIGTSMRMVCGKTFDRNIVAAKLYHYFEKWYKIFLIDRPFVFSKWLDFSGIVGKKCLLREFDGKEIHFFVHGIDEDGFLTGRDILGNDLVVTAGDIFILTG